MQANAEASRASEIRSIRDQWLSIIATKYSDIDFADVFEVLKELTNPGPQRGSQNSRQSQHNETPRVCWDLTAVRTLTIPRTSEINEVNRAIANELNPQSLPEIGKLSLNNEDRTRMAGIQIILDEADGQNNIFAEPDSAVFEQSFV